MILVEVSLVLTVLVIVAGLDARRRVKAEVQAEREREQKRLLASIIEFPPPPYGSHRQPWRAHRKDMA